MSTPRFSRLRSVQARKASGVYSARSSGARRPILVATKNVSPGRSREEAADHPLAAPVAVDVGGVDEGHAGVGRRVERAQAVGVVHRAPVAADRPRPEPDDADVAPGLAEPAVLHAVGLLWRGAGCGPAYRGPGARAPLRRLAADDAGACPSRSAGRQGRGPNGQGFRDLRPSAAQQRDGPICHNRDVAVSPGGPSPDGAPAPAARFHTRPDRGSAFVTRRTPSVDTPATARARGFRAPRGTRPGRRRGRRRVTGGGIRPGSREWRRLMAFAMEQTVQPDGRVELLPEVDAGLGASGAPQRGPGPGPDREADLDHLQLPRPVGRHGDQHPDLAAGLRPDRPRDGLVPGALHDLPRQRPRPDPDAADQPRGHQVRHPVPGHRAGVVRHLRRQPAGPDARVRRLRLVRHPDLDRRHGAVRRHRSAAPDADGRRLGLDGGAGGSPSASATRPPSRGRCGCASRSSGPSTS